MNWNYVIMKDGLYYTEKPPVWGPTFTPERKDAKVYDTWNKAYEKLESWRGQFPTAKVIKLEKWS